MLLGYGAKNAWSFKEGIEIDLRLNDLVPEDVSMKLPAATAMCFKGPNAAGKTNALKILAFIVDYIINSFQYKPDALILYDSYFLNEEQSDFYIDFELNGSEYSYDFSTTQKNILTEKFQKDGEILFERKNDKIIVNKIYQGHEDIIFRNNASFFSTIYQYGISEIKEIYTFFENMLMNVTYTGLYNIDRMDYRAISELYDKKPKMLEFVKKIISKFDTGVNDIIIQNKKTEVEDLYYPLFIHIDESGDKLPLLFQMESKGTQSLFCMLSRYYAALERGSVLVIDEFEEYLDPDILPELLYLFIKKENNTKNAQILFSNHNVEIMDTCGRYRTYLFQKNNNASFCYRLDEVPKLRNDRPVSKSFRKHLIGGYTRIGE